MKKLLIFLILLLVAVSLISCGGNGYYEQGYEDGYAEGFAAGHLEAELELYDKRFEAGHDVAYDDGYYEGHDDGYDEARLIIDMASEHAREQTGWSVYEAWNNIAIYHDGVDPHGHELPTEEEYRQSVETLVLFCEYLDNAGLGG